MPKKIFVKNSSVNDTAFDSKLTLSDELLNSFILWVTTVFRQKDFAPDGLRAEISNTATSKHVIIQWPFEDFQGTCELFVTFLKTIIEQAEIAKLCYKVCDGKYSIGLDDDVVIEMELVSYDDPSLEVEDLRKLAS